MHGQVFPMTRLSKNMLIFSFLLFISICYSLLSTLFDIDRIVLIYDLKVLVIQFDSVTGYAIFVRDKEGLFDGVLNITLVRASQDLWRMYLTLNITKSDKVIYFKNSTFYFNPITRVLYSINMSELGISGFILNTKSVSANNFTVVSFSNYTFQGSVIGESKHYVIDGYQECVVVRSILEIGRNRFGPFYLYDSDTGCLVHADGIVIDPALYYMDNIFFLIVETLDLAYSNIDLGPTTLPFFMILIYIAVALALTVTLIVSTFILWRRKYSRYRQDRINIQLLQAS